MQVIKNMINSREIKTVEHDTMDHAGGKAETYASNWDNLFLAFCSNIKLEEPNEQQVMLMTKY